MKNTVLKTVIFGMALVFPVLFNGCKTPVDNQNSAPQTLEGEWEGTSAMGAPVLMIIDRTTITLESLMTKSKGTYEDKNGTILYQGTHIYDSDTNQFVAVEAYMEKAKQEYLASLDSSLESGFITQEEYEADRALADTLFAVPGPETMPYTLEGNRLTLTLADMGTVALARR